MSENIRFCRIGDGVYLIGYFIRWELDIVFTTKMVADFYGVDERTIKRYIQDHGDELRANGYFLSQGKELKDIKIQIGDDINWFHCAELCG